MAFLLKNTSLSQLRLQPQFENLLPKIAAADSFPVSRRGIHVEPGAREKALLAPDPALKRFKSHKKSVWRLKKIGDVLTIVVVAGCCYEIYVKAVMREEARKQAKESM